MDLNRPLQMLPQHPLRSNDARTLLVGKFPAVDAAGGKQASARHQVPTRRKPGNIPDDRIRSPDAPDAQMRIAASSPHHHQPHSQASKAPFIRAGNIAAGHRERICWTSTRMQLTISRNREQVLGGERTGSQPTAKRISRRNDGHLPFQNQVLTPSFPRIAGIH